MQHRLLHRHWQSGGRINLLLHHVHGHGWVWIADHDLDLCALLHQHLNGLVIEAGIVVNLDLFGFIPPVFCNAALTHQRVLEQRIGGHKTIVVVAEDVIRIVSRLLSAGNVLRSTRYILHDILTAEEHFHQAWQHGADGVSHLHRNHLRAPIFLVAKGVATVILCTLGADGRDIGIDVADGIFQFTGHNALQLGVVHRIDCRDVGGHLHIVDHFLFLAEIALAFALASALLDAPHALRDNSSRVGSPFFISAPGILPILARNDALRGLSPVFTGAFRFMPSAFALARPLAFKPPLGFFPSLRCHAGVFIGYFLQNHIHGVNCTRQSHYFLLR